ncbi:Nuclear pore complex protein NUP93A [Camellia lanceoleosa]|uniref:Nuclear pore complex protein NUP93A n=1 Tax=Camellia lanceoleosa TaxID=1840588 RepID=A0ACC0GDW9_9ERIC|nr:Nuclear pore complex protein NUP93A [Camellia lanceoleosa]
MANEADVGGWTDLLHSSSKLLEQAAPLAQFPPLQLCTGWELKGENNQDNRILQDVQFKDQKQCNLFPKVRLEWRSD